LKLKLDENIGRRPCELLRSSGHDVATVHDEGLCSANDEVIIEASKGEQRCLVTLDIEFGNPIRYRPANYSGIAVLRLPSKPTPADMELAVRTLIRALEPNIAGHLWVIEAGRIRVYQDPDEDPLGED
jgi:predicted nuclease of predicted toxin-antitoxin system